MVVKVWHAAKCLGLAEVGICQAHSGNQTAVCIFFAQSSSLQCLVLPADSFVYSILHLTSKLLSIRQHDLSKQR